jgi:hypothetical protein
VESGGKVSEWRQDEVEDEVESCDEQRRGAGRNEACRRGRRGSFWRIRLVEGFGLSDWSEWSASPLAAALVVLPVRERDGVSVGVGGGLSPDRMLSAFIAGAYPQSRWSKSCTDSQVSSSTYNQCII